MKKNQFEVSKGFLSPPYSPENTVSCFSFKDVNVQETDEFPANTKHTVVGVTTLFIWTCLQLSFFISVFLTTVCAYCVTEYGAF